MTITIVPATAERFDDAEHTFSGRGDGLSCQCQWWTLTNAQFQASDQQDRERMLRAQVATEPSPALIAYVDGEPAGWCGFGPRADVERFRASKTILPIDDLPVWSIICFVVTPRFRGRGLARELLNAAVDYARDQGAPAVEGYPVDPGEKRIGAGAAFVGTTALYESAGFTRMGETAAKTAGLPRWVMRRATS